MWSQRLSQFLTSFYFCTINVSFWADLFCIYVAACGWHTEVHCRFYSECWRCWSCLQVVPPLFWFGILALTILRLDLSYFFGSQHWQDTLFFLFPDLLTVSASLTFKSMAIAIMVHHTMHLALRGVPKGRWRNHFWGMIVSMFLCWIDKNAKNILCAVCHCLLTLSLFPFKYKFDKWD